MVSEYRDKWIEATDAEIRIRGYYIPWGTKHIPYGRLRSIRRVPMGLVSGRGRIWGTADVRYWASLDPRRPSKRTGLILDLGASVRPFITPDDPDAFEAAVRRHVPDLPASTQASRLRVI